MLGFIAVRRPIDTGVIVQGYNKLRRLEQLDRTWTGAGLDVWPRHRSVTRPITRYSVERESQVARARGRRMPVLGAEVASRKLIGLA